MERSPPHLPQVPSLSANSIKGVWLTVDGEIEELSHEVVVQRLAISAPPLVCHAPATARRLGIKLFQAFDILELFAFVAPAHNCIPTPRGVASAIDMNGSEIKSEQPKLIQLIAKKLLTIVTEQTFHSDSVAIARSMERGGWLWSKFVLAALDEHAVEATDRKSTGLEIWHELEEWSEDVPPPAGDQPVEAVDARTRLATMIGKTAEARPSQADYASAATRAFQPRNVDNEPHFLLAEAGTGVGKTKGYLAPASLWAEKNGAPVWISTYTRNLQHQIDQELTSLFSDPTTKNSEVVLRKGRENYLCLLNLEEAVSSVEVLGKDAVALGLMLRWAAETRDGDVNGGDFPAWLSDLVGYQHSVGLTDHRGECIYSACSHYSRCFIERGIRRARYAKIVIANHTLVMIQAAHNRENDHMPAVRYVFDEGHHVFDAADSVFSVYLSGLETADLRRWLCDSRSRQHGRDRGLKKRIEDLVEENDDSSTLKDILAAAQALPGDGWHQRCVDGRPKGTVENFLTAVRNRVFALSGIEHTSYSLEVVCDDLDDELIAAASELNSSLLVIEEPLSKLMVSFAARLEENFDTLEIETRSKLESVLRSLSYKGLCTIQSWRSMLSSLTEGTPEQFVDWFSVDRIDGREIDIGLKRHWVDPTLPFVKIVAEPAHGLIITSATLKDGSGDLETDWRVAESRTGVQHLSQAAIRAEVPSPFDYKNLTRVIVVTDVHRGNINEVAAAYRELFTASRGGALGLFTAISRLREVHKLISNAIDEAGLSLYAQHVDGLNLATLVDIFRAEQNACLLGTDAMRDGVDVPGTALRLIVFERVPWPRPTILHRARRLHFGGPALDDTVTRLRLKQAFGRLVRQETDRGVFVLLDPMMPSRLAGAFPPGVDIIRVSLSEAVNTVRSFLPNDMET